MLRKLTLVIVALLFCTSGAIADSGPKVTAASDNSLNKNPSRVQLIKSPGVSSAKKSGIGTKRACKNPTCATRNW